ncbi:MAG: DUF1189 family protein [Elusimicrobiota bacterium]
MITDPLKSVIDFAFYRDVPKKSLGATFGYIAYLGLIYSVVVVIALFVHLRPKIQEAVDWASTEVPEMTLADGKLSSSAQGLTVVRHPKAEELTVIIDTDRTTAVTPAEMHERKALAYLTQNAIYVVRGGSAGARMEAYDLSKAQNEKPVSINAEFYQSLGSVLTTILYPAALLTSWLIFLLWKHAAALIYSLVALLINAGVGGRLEFSELYKLAVYAQTPVIVLQMVTLLLLKPIPYFRVLAFIVVGVYLWQAIRQHVPPPDAV